MKNFFSYNHTSGTHSVFSPAKTQEVLRKIEQVFCDVNEDGNYQINIPESFFDFAEHEILELSENVIAQRLFNSSEAAFYSCKKIWQNIFGRKLKLKKQPRIFSKSEYEKLLANSISLLKKNNSLKKDDIENIKEKNISHPVLDDLLSLEINI